MVAYWQEAGAGKRRPDAQLAQFTALGPLRAVVFEPAGVLFDATPRRRWLWQLATRHGVSKTYDEFFEPWDRTHLPPVLRGECDYAVALQTFLASLELTAAQLDEVAAAMPLRGQSLEWCARPLLGVTRALSRLDNCGVALAILADCPLDAGAYGELLRESGLGRHFETVITSVELKSVKPAAANFAAVAAALKRPHHEIGFVGSRSDDLQAAAMIGMRTISVGDVRPSVAEIELPTLQRLPDLVLQSMNSRAKAA